MYTKTWCFFFFFYWLASKVFGRSCVTRQRTTTTTTSTTTTTTTNHQGFFCFVFFIFIKFDHVCYTFALWQPNKSVGSQLYNKNGQVTTFNVKTILNLYVCTFVQLFVYNCNCVHYMGMCTCKRCFSLHTIGHSPFELFNCRSYVQHQGFLRSIVSSSDRWFFSHYLFHACL